MRNEHTKIEAKEFLQYNPKYEDFQRMLSLYFFGVPHIWATGFEKDSGYQYASTWIVEVPLSLPNRKDVFALVSDFAFNLESGTEVPIKDVGQTEIVLDFRVEDD